MNRINKFLRPRFSLRALFVTMTLLGCLIGWVVYQLNWIRQRHEAAANALVSVNLRANREMVIFRGGGSIYRGLGPASYKAPWQLRLFGEQGHPVILVRLPESDPEF